MQMPIRANGLMALTACYATVAVAGVALAQPAPKMTGKPDPQMQSVLTSLAELKPKPIAKLTPAQARVQPGPPDAVKRLLVKQGRSTAPEPVGSVMDTKIPGPNGPVPVRVYKPKNAPSGPLPVIVYFHGGGFVIASVTAYDSSIRALSNAAGAMVVAVGYRMAPEYRLPTAHEDSYAVTQYVMNNAARMGGDPKKVAVVGESAGGHLAVNMSQMAVARGGMIPIRQVLVYPMAQYGNFNTPSYIEQRNAKPLNRPMMKWFFKYALPTDMTMKQNMNDPLISPLRASSSILRQMPPTTIILAEIDPLRSDGMMLGDRLKALGVPTHIKVYPGVTHEFFGMGAVVDKAKDAVNVAASDLKASFARAK